TPAAGVAGELLVEGRAQDGQRSGDGGIDPQVRLASRGAGGARGVDHRRSSAGTRAACPASTASRASSSSRTPASSLRRPRLKRRLPRARSSSKPSATRTWEGTPVVAAAPAETLKPAPARAACSAAAEWPGKYTLRVFGSTA